MMRLSVTSDWCEGRITGNWSNPRHYSTNLDTGPRAGRRKILLECDTGPGVLGCYRHLTGLRRGRSSGAPTSGQRLRAPCRSRAAFSERCQKRHRGPGGRGRWPWFGTGGGTLPVLWGDISAQWAMRRTLVRYRPWSPCRMCLWFKIANFKVSAMGHTFCVRKWWPETDTRHPARVKGTWERSPLCGIFGAVGERNETPASVPMIHTQNSYILPWLYSLFKNKHDEW